MSVRNALVLLLALSTLTLLVGCGGSSSPTVVPPPSGSFSNSNLSGTYVFSVSGEDPSGNTLAMAGTFTANGQGGNGTGGINGGTIDINDAAFAAASPVIPPVTNAPIKNTSFYSVGVNGRGSMTLGTSTPLGNITFEFVLTSSTHGLVTEFDKNGSGSGTIDLQTSGLTQSSFAGPYAFSLAGVDLSDNPDATAGAFTLDQNGNITAGSGVQDFDDAGFAYTNQALSGSAVLGTGTAPGSATLATDTFGTLSFDFYAIDATHLKFIETDSLPILSGDVFTQTGASIPTGAMVFALAGLDSSGPVAAGGLMTSAGAGSFPSGLEDLNDAGNLSPAQLIFSGTPAGAAGVGGRIDVNFSGFSPAFQFAIYPYSGGGGGVLMLETDGLGAIMAGAAYAQSATSFAASQGYGLNLSGSNGAEVDDIAEFTAGSATSSPNVTGILDENDDGATNKPETLSGTYTPDSPATGRGSIVVPTLAYGILELDLEYYVVDSSTIIFIEGDTNQVSVGTFELQTPSNSSGAVLAARLYCAVLNTATRGSAEEEIVRRTMAQTIGRGSKPRPFSYSCIPLAPRAAVRPRTFLIEGHLKSNAPSVSAARECGAVYGAA